MLPPHRQGGGPGGSGTSESSLGWWLARVKVARRKPLGSPGPMAPPRTWPLASCSSPEYEYVWLRVGLGEHCHLALAAPEAQVMPLVHLNQVFIQDFGGQASCPAQGCVLRAGGVLVPTGHSQQLCISEALAAWEGSSSPPGSQDAYRAVVTLK